MSPLSIQVPFPVFQDRNGQPLDNGYVWVGSPNLPPQTNPVAVYFDAALTIPAAQPLRTINGYISNSGTPAQIYIDGVNFSVLVQDKKGTTVYTFPSGTGISPNASGVSFVGANGDVTNLQALGLPSGLDLVGFKQIGVGAVDRTALEKAIEFVSVKDFGAVGDGVTDDALAIQTAVSTSGPNSTIVYPDGTYLVGSTISLETQQHHMGLNAVIKVASNTVAFQRTTDGFPGRVKFSDLRFEGTGNTGKAISIVNNTPFVQLENCYFSSFERAVELSGSYCSSFSSCYFSYNIYGLLLLNECHSTQLVNCFFDGNTYAGLAINGTPTDGNLGARVHNITSIGCAYQNSEFGLWVESCYEFAAYNTYHEGNTKADMRLGVGDSGTYARFCYHFTIDSWQSSSPCALGKNIIIEHAVNGNLRGLAFNSGTSTTATVLEVDSYSDLINIDYSRVQTISPNASTPFSFLLDASNRVVVAHNGRPIYYPSLKALRFGTMASQEGAIWKTFTSGGRPLLQLEHVGTNCDMGFKVSDIERHMDGAGVDKFQIDHLNTQFVFGYELLPDIDNTHTVGFTSKRWSVIYAATGTINTSDEREKQDIEPIPQSWLDAWGDVQYARFKFKDAVAKKGGGARWHIGLVAQRVKEAFESRGIDPFGIGLLCFDSWESEVDTNGNVLPAGERYGIRYEEALALECAYLRSKLGA